MTSVVNLPTDELQEIVLQACRDTKTGLRTKGEVVNSFIPKISESRSRP